ncbi:MAG TPA: hypothetical protein VGN69_00065 [Solirubrobacteraceae bacterium]|jgi:uncharacterized protein (DUF58 family)|nr:hypothetical protein [Solirubrobacteraceae bacterium]
MGAVLGIVLVAVVVVLVAVGLTPIIFVPLGIVALVILGRPLFGALLSDGPSGGASAPRTPSTAEASYQPVVDPSER